MVRPRNVHRVDSDLSTHWPIERSHSIPGTGLSVMWDQMWEAYTISGPAILNEGAPLRSIKDVEAALAPVKVPEEVREGLIADRSMRPPYVSDEWRHLVDIVTALMEPLGAAVTQVVPHLSEPRIQAVEVSIDPDRPEAGRRVRQIVVEAGYCVYPSDRGHLIMRYPAGKEGALSTHRRPS